MLNYFDLFGLSVRYLIDENELTVAYLKKQRETHPDNSGNSSDSSILNLAYSVLKNPLLRAEYILSLIGKNTNTMPQYLALKMCDLREQFAEIQSDEDKNEFVRHQQEYITNILKILQKHKIDSDEFFNLFCEAKFIHSFLEKVKNNACNWN